MTDDAGQENAVPFVTPVPSVMTPRPARGPDPDRFQKLAKRLVMENYNASRDPAKNPELTVDAFHIVTFTRTMTHWKTVVESLAANRLTWIVTYNGTKNEAYIEILKKLARVKVQLDGQ